MDRPKAPGNRGMKSKPQQFPSDLVKLGPARPRSDNNESRKPASGPIKSGSGSSSGSSSSSMPNLDRRRLAGSTNFATSSIPPTKKPKLPHEVFGRSLLTGSNVTTEPSRAWESGAIDVDSIDLIATVTEAKEKDENGKIPAIICGAIRQLKLSKMKVDACLFHGLLYLAKIHPVIFTSDNVLTALCSTLRREQNLQYKMKTTYQNAVLIVNLLFFGYQHVQHWPEIFIKMFIDDSFSDRLWVDSNECKCFVDNIICSVKTIVPSHDVLAETKNESSEGNIMSIIGEEYKEYCVNDRYQENKKNIESLIMNAVNEQMSRRQAIEGINKNFLKFLCSVCGISEVRAVVAPKLESWLSNPKWKNDAKLLLLTLCVNCTTNTPRDVEVISHIVKIKFKNKDLHGLYFASIKEMIMAHDNNLQTAMQQVVSNEMSINRNQNFVPMTLFSCLYQAEPDQFATILANLYVEYMVTRDDSLKQLRSLLREIVKVLRTELDLQCFIGGIIRGVYNFAAGSELKDRIFVATVDLITLVIFSSVSLYAKTERKDMQQVGKIQMAVAKIQCDSVEWFFSSVMQIFRPSHMDYLHNLQKILLLEPQDQYYRVDNWPPEQDRHLIFKHATEVPVLQETINNILRIGLSRENAVTCVESLDLVDRLVLRVSIINQKSDVPMLPADNTDTIDLLFNSSAYRHPETTALPENYFPPSLTIIALYWKSWIILLTYCAHAPKIFGTLAWEKYPTLRTFIEMCIISKFDVPAGIDDQQLLSTEKHSILEYENYLAQNTITESSSLLLPQLITMNPFADFRRPPEPVLEHLKIINREHKIGQLLCYSRNPDFLLEITNKQGPLQSMIWLSELVHNFEGSFDYLPVPCLCEYLLCNTSTVLKDKYKLVVDYLRDRLISPASDVEHAREILDHFLKRISSSSTRDQTLSGLKLLLNTSNEVDVVNVDEELNYGELSSWIFAKLPEIPHFEQVKSSVVSALRQACQLENDPDMITSYLIFLSQHVAVNNCTFMDISLLVLDMASLIIERSTIMPIIIPSDDATDSAALNALLKIFSVYINKVRENDGELQEWDGGEQEKVILMWPSTGDEIVYYVSVIHAIVILLTNKVFQASPAYLYSQSLLNLFFPENKQLTPKALHVEAREPVLIFPDWLKLKMLKSNEDRLVDEAFNDLGPQQWLLFVQSFGMPVKTIRLLKTLDDAIVKDTNILLEHGVDRAYMLKLINVQHIRGATGGEVFLHTLEEMNMDVEIEDDKIVDLNFPKSAKSADIDIEIPINKISEEEIDHVIDSMGSTLQLNIHQKLLKVLADEILHSSKSNAYSTVVLKSISNKLVKKCTTKGLKDEFVNRLVTGFHFPCNLMRLLTSSRNKDNFSLLIIVAKLVLQCPVAKKNEKNPLVKNCKTFLDENNYSELTAEIAKQTKTKQSDDVLALLKDCSIDQLEQIGNTYLIESTMKKVHGSGTVVDTIAKLITNSENKFENASGLFTDWLIQVEPEILASSLDTQMDMLFSQRSNVKWKTLQACRPYLLTLLTHHASWKTIELAVSKLLTMEATKQYDPTAVLDFLWAVTRNPRLWQGRDNFSPKNQERPDMLQLPENELLCVVEYIVEEVEMIGCDRNGLIRMGLRLFQFVECALKLTDTNVILSIVTHLTQYNVSETRRSICRNLLGNLYMRIPRIVDLLNQMKIQIDHEKVAKADRDNSALDVMSHTLITAFTTSEYIKENRKKHEEFELLLRKMCSVHPRLVLRQIQIFQTSILGRTHLEWTAFRANNNQIYFQQVFGILELLQPDIFDPDFNTSLHTILNVYISLFKSHAGKKEVDLLVPKFISFCLNYVSYDSKSATTFLQQCSNCVRDLMIDYPDMSSLNVLAGGFLDSNKREAILPAAADFKDEIPELETYMNGLKNDSAVTLAELENRTFKKPKILEPLLDRLLPFLQNTSSQTRTSAHTLVLRCLKHNPAMASKIFPAMYNCLRSNSAEVITSACVNVPELVACYQENAVPILKILFSLRTNKNIDTTSCINRTISLLNMQYC